MSWVWVSDCEGSASACLKHLTQIHHRLNLMQAYGRKYRKQVMLFDLREKADKDCVITVNRLYDQGKEHRHIERERVVRAISVATR